MSKPPKRRLPPTVGAQLRAARLRQHRTLGDLAKALGTNAGYLSAVETGSIKPSKVERLLRWAKELGLSGEELALQAWAEKAPREIRTLVLSRLYGMSASERSAAADAHARTRLRQALRAALGKSLQDLHKALDDLTQ